MATENKKRRKDRKKRQDDSPWGSLLQSDEPPIGDPGMGYDDEAAYPTEEDAEGNSWRDWWHKFSVWSLLALLIFLIFTGGLILMTFDMWRPQEMRSIPGYADNGTARDLTSALKAANGGEIAFTEGEINRYLRDTCRLRQTGIFSVLAHAQGAAVRMHDGYAELIIDRVLSTHFHQTTAVHLSFVREFDHGRPKLRMELRGGEPIMGSLPLGGSIGRVRVPQRYMEMLRPALETIQDCYPEFFDLIETYGYKPEFYRGRNGQEGFVRLVPYTPATS